MGAISLHIGGIPPINSLSRVPISGFQSRWGQPPRRGSEIGGSRCQTMHIPFIVNANRPPYFPPNLPSDKSGIVAVGGKLSNEILIEAYSLGYFPWYENEPIMWYSPEPRTLLLPKEFKISKRFLRWKKKTDLNVSSDTCFETVIKHCALTKRPGQSGGTWINKEVFSAYCNLHRSGYAHSIEVYDENELVGGLYGVSLGKCFFGESMFSLRMNTSKLALFYLIQYSLKKGFNFIDCQVPTSHLKSLGARDFSKKHFEAMLKVSLEEGVTPYLWKDDFKRWYNPLK